MTSSVFKPDHTNFGGRTEFNYSPANPSLPSFVEVVIEVNDEKFFLSAAIPANAIIIKPIHPSKEYLSTYRQSFSNGRDAAVYTHPNKLGKVTISEVDGTLQIKSDEQFMGYAYYYIPIKLHKNSRHLKIDIERGVINKSFPAGNTTLVQVFINDRPSNPKFKGTLQAYKSFETSSDRPLNNIGSFSLKSDVSKFSGKTVYLGFVMRDAWAEQYVRMTIFPVEVTQSSQKL
jgi:hypothetical protein